MFARNDVTVAAAATSYLAGLTWNWDQPSFKLTADVQGGTVYIRLSEAIGGGYTGPELKLRPGAHSRTFATPVYGLQVRNAGGADVLFDWSLYA